MRNQKLKCEGAVHFKFFIGRHLAVLRCLLLAFVFALLVCGSQLAVDRKCIVIIRNGLGSRSVMVF